jgi:hypothetical protein
MKRSSITMKPVIAIILVGALAIPVSGSAQVRREEARTLGTTRPIVAKVRVAKAVVPIGRVPDSALSIHGWQGVTIARTAPAPPGGISSPGATIYVSKSWVNPPQPKRDHMCSSRTSRADSLDLSEPRRHGFQLASFKIEPLPPPKGYVLSTTGGPVRRGGSSFIDANGNATEQMAQAARITLSSSSYQLYTMRQMPVFCFTGYRVNISLYGPVGIDPFTGKTIQRSPVN